MTSFLFACVGAARGGGQRGERGQRGVVGGQDVAPFTGEEANLSAEGLGLLRLCFHQLLKPRNLLLVHASPVILERSALNTHKQIQTQTNSYIYNMSIHLISKGVTVRAFSSDFLGSVRFCSTCLFH